MRIARLLRIGVLLVCPLLPFVLASVTARVWRPSKEGFVFPELDAELNKPLADLIKSKDNFGIALAGGGLRGSFLSHGIVRSLRNVSILEKARYMSVTSGSVWFGIPFQFQTQDSLDTFLGDSLPPEQCTPDALVSAQAGSYVTRSLRWPITQFPKNMTPPDNELLASNPQLLQKNNGSDDLLRRSFEEMHGLERGIIDRILNCFQNMCECAADVTLPNLNELWNILTAYLAMHPFGLARPYSHYCHAHDLPRAQKELGRFAHIYSSQDVKNKLPFLLSQSAAMALKTGLDQQTNPLLSFYLENTPMYAGVPMQYPAANNTAGEPLYDGLGDLYIEPFGFDSTPLEKVPEAPKGEMKVDPHWSLLNAGAVADWAGISTSYVAAFQIRPWATKLPRCEVSAGEKLMPHAYMWSPLNADSKGVPVTQDMPVGDAGIYDDLGHLALLRRGIEKMVITDSSAVHDHEFGPEKVNLLEMVYTLAAFGQPGGLKPPNPAGSPNPLSPANFTTVFEPSEFAKFWAKVKELYIANKPIVIRDKFTVVDNPWFGIKGGRQVEIIWALMTPVAQWRDALPARTKANLPYWLPNVYSAEPANLFFMSALSQYASWFTQKAVIPEITAMLSEAGHSDSRASKDLAFV